MNIVVEGVDASGKSTLIKRLVSERPRFVVASEGPPKYAGEMNVRVVKYRQYEDVIFDRHPCVSQPIYGKLRTHFDAIEKTLTEAFYSTRPFFVYCRPNLSRGFDNHVADAHEDPAHLDAVKHNYMKLLRAYDEWALDHAHVVYRLGQDFERTINTIIKATDVRSV
jgi:GTPase SAR1 family protein